MKTLIVFSSTYGFTKECVEELKSKLKGEVTAVEVAKGNIPSPSEYDKIIIGSSIYMGQVNKKVKEFCLTNSSLLTKKQLGFFVCCGMPENFDTVIANAFPQELLQVAASKECFGGELRISKMKFLHKMITGMMKKATEKEGKPEPAKIPESISRMAQVMNAL